MLISTQDTLRTEAANKRDPDVRLATVRCTGGAEQSCKGAEDQRTLRPQEQKASCNAAQTSMLTAETNALALFSGV